MVFNLKFLLLFPIIKISLFFLFLISVGYVTDVEGNLDYWNRYIEFSNILARNSNDGEIYLKENCQFVYGGDVCDRGMGDIQILQDLLKLKLQYVERVHFIMGNRDINKLRLPFSLSNFALKHPPVAFWFNDINNSNTKENNIADNKADRLKWVKFKYV